MNFWLLIESKIKKRFGDEKWNKVEVEYWFLEEIGELKKSRDVTIMRFSFEKGMWKENWEFSACIIWSRVKKMLKEIGNQIIVRIIRKRVRDQSKFLISTHNINNNTLFLPFDRNNVLI